MSLLCAETEKGNAEGNATARVLGEFAMRS
jgi:hypothetical protein